MADIKTNVDLTLLCPQCDFCYVTFGGFGRHEAGGSPYQVTHYFKGDFSAFWSIWSEFISESQVESYLIPSEAAWINCRLSV